MPKRIFLLVPLFAALVASARDKPENWLEVRSPHFVVLSDSSEKQARHVADQFERMRTVFHAMFPQAHVDPGTPIVVLAVKDKKDFQSLEPAAYLAEGQLELAGLFLRAPDKNYVLLRLDAQGEHPYATVYHEYTHLLSSRAEAWLPLWLNEGLAEFYQNTDIRDKEVLLGEPSTGNILLLRQEHLLPLPTLFTIDYNSPYYHEENKGSIFYAESWALTHYLQIKDSRENTHRLTDYAQLVSQKVDPVTAATKVFGDLKQLQATLQKYVAQGTFYQFKAALTTDVDETAFKVAVLSPSEADAVRADFLVYDQRTKEARTLLEQVLREDPSNASAHESMGYLEFRQGNLAEARKWYEQAVKLNSQSFLAYYYFAAITMNSGQLDSENKSQVENSLRTAIKLNPSFAPAYDQLAVFYGMRRENLDEAHTLVLNAVQLDPGNFHYRLSTANILLQMQRPRDAIAVLKNAGSLAKTPEEVNLVQDLLQAAQQGQSPPQTELSSTEQKQEPPASTSNTQGPAQPSTTKTGEDYGLGLGRKATAAMGPMEVLTDTRGVDFGPYLQRVVHDVRMNWYNLIPAQARAPLMKKGKVIIEFAIKKDGNVGGMTLVSTSGDVALDRGAWGGITGCNPFPPLPNEFGGQYIGLRFAFFYNPGRADLAGAPTMLEKSSIDLRNKANVATKAGNYSVAIDLLNRAVEADPRNKMAWNDLGLAYLDSRQDDLAIRSFQKQIEVSPNHEYAYNNLGRVYLRQRKYEEAIKWFRKQIEIDPLDKYAHSNLGVAYMEQHKYAEAVPELEQGASLTPDNAESQVRLGTAYLNLGQDEKAMAAFDKALKVSATPLIWNNIAYQLTVKKAHPDVARHYAESAVTTTAVALRNLSFDQLGPQNIGTTSSLAAYWDTLGWVEFTDGDLDKAEKYLLAAWQLGQRSAGADHLGQLCEKRGEKDRALHFYALAMSARRPEPETRSRLAALAVGNDKVGAIVEKSQDELSAQRTIKLGNNASKQEGRAEFFLLLTSGQGSQASVEDVKFVSGDEKLKVFVDALRVARYGQTIPDETAVKLLRRGTLSCTAAADCTLLLALPEDVKSVD